MKAVAQVVIVGGGVAGASIAYYLAKKGTRQIILLERDSLASGATGRSACLVRMHYANPWDASLALKSFEVFRSWSDAIGGQCGFKKTGFLMLGSHRDADKVRANVRMLQGIGVNTRAVSGEEVKILQPFMNVEDVGAAAYEPDSGFADGSDTVHSLIAQARDMGVRVKQDALVTGIRVEKGKVKGVVLKDGEVEAPMVVIAAGAWSAPLAQTAGVELPVEARRISAGILQRPPAIGDHMVVIDRARGSYFRPDAPGLTLLGVRSTVAHQQEKVDPDNFSSHVGHAEMAHSASKLSFRIPAMAEAGWRRTWAGVDGFTPDGHAILDRVSEVEGLYIAAGFSGTGFKTGPAVGMCMAELIVDGRASTVDIDAFRLSRFQENKPLVGEHEYTSDKDEGGLTFH